MKRSALEYVGITALSLLLLVKGVVPAWTRVHSDFANYYVSSKLLVEGDDLSKLYENEWFQQQIHSHGIDQDGKFAPFPPATAWLMVPLTPFEPLTAQRIWTVLNLAFLVLHVYLVTRLTSWNWRTSTLFLLAGGLSLANNFAFGQVYLIMSGCLMVGHFSTRKQFPVASAALVGLFTAIKYFPVVYLPGYLIARRFKFVLLAGLSILTLFVLQIVLFGSDVVRSFITQVFVPHLDGNLASQGQFTYYYQSWDSLLRFIFVKDAVYNPNPLFNWDTGRLIGKTLVYSSMLYATGHVLWKCRDLTMEYRLPLFLALPALVALSLLPVSASYHFILLCFPLALLFGTHLLSTREQIALALLYVAVGFIPYGIAFTMAEKWGIFFAYPRLWLLSSLAILSLVLVNRNVSQLNILGI